MPEFSQLAPVRRTMAVAVAALTLGACTSMLKEAPVATYDLTAPRGFSGRPSAGRGVLVIAEPTAIQTVDSNRMVARAGGQVSYVPAAQWSDRLPSLLQTRIVQSFENSGRIASVGRAEDGLVADYQLVTDIRAFEVNVTAAGTVATVEIAAKIVGERNGGRAVSGRVFHAEVPAGQVNGPEAARALDQALGQVLVEMVNWAGGVV